MLGVERLFENKPKVEFGEMVLGEKVTQGTGGTEGTGTAISVAAAVRDGEETAWRVGGSLRGRKGGGAVWNALALLREAGPL